MSAWLDIASTVSQYPSMCMPPDTASGMSVSPNASIMGGNEKKPESMHQRAQRTPTAIPTTGKAARMNLIFVSFQSICGIGITENIEKAAASDLKKLIYYS